MKINFKKFESNYYNDICNFLVEISKRIIGILIGIGLDGNGCFFIQSLIEN